MVDRQTQKHTVTVVAAGQLCQQLRGLHYLCPPLQQGCGKVDGLAGQVGELIIANGDIEMGVDVTVAVTRRHVEKYQAGRE